LAVSLWKYWFAVHPQHEEREATMNTLTMSKGNVWLRFFLWAWEANPEKLNICRLFWGVVFLPIGIFFVKDSVRPFYCLSRLGATWLFCLVFPYLFFGEYVGALVFSLLVFCSMAYNHLNRIAIAIKCDKQETEARAKKAKLEEREYKFSPRGEKILEKISQPIIWIVVFMMEKFDLFSLTKSGERITGFMSLCYHFLLSTKQRTCLFVKVE
jgi:hypothetical protein